ncbi:carbohydrate kinase [Saccharopolyspora rhizosphaerae]|uniref:Carbohydrate kinase n=1 Tax=Saccharopolyspora rhizosphaerae TaxID=2492662 RepID=A0A3R8PXN7_9PSEU|nr:carbohydrate kinase [Saccharopolyspora rhizosphaerae]RRO14112.1 carbohydrate kinase [Saccharopolyspora rhizosphaerae]
MIVVGGEALIDLVATESVAPPALPDRASRLGGGPYNVAIALARLGSPVSMLSRISTDDFGEALVHGLRESGVDTGLLQRGPEPTTLAVASPGPDGSARYSFSVQGTADRLVVDPGPLPPQVSAVSLGTLSMVLEPGASAYESLLRRESARGVFVALDPNVRAELIDDADAYRARFERWLPHLGLLKVSEEDACWLAAGAEPVAEAVQRWAGMGPSAVVLTRGADGLSVVRPDGTRFDVECQRSAVVDTIGAGDTVQAALLHWLHHNDALGHSAVRAMPAAAWREALAYAATAAALTCSRPGAQPPTADELPSPTLEAGALHSAHGPSASRA